MPLESQELARLVREATEAQRDTVKALEAISRVSQAASSQLDQQAEQIQNLENALFRGHNGNVSLSIQVVTLKQETAVLKDQIESLRTEFRSCSQSHSDEDKEKRNRFLIIMSLIIAALAMIGQIWPHIFHPVK